MGLEKSIKQKDSMQKKRMEQYVNLQKEIIMLEEEILKLELFGEEYVSDSVQSSSGPGFSKRNVVIKGYGSRKIPNLRARKVQCEIECEIIDKYIENVNDSLMRQILHRKYIEGKTLTETAQIVGYSRNQIGRIIKKFFENMVQDGAQCG